MKKHKKLKYVLIICLGVILLSIGGVLLWTSNTYAPTQDLYELVAETAYSQEGDTYLFEPKGEANGTGVIIYPGALVEPLAYGYYANELSKAGYWVAIPEVNLNLSITESDKAGEIIAKHSEINEWYVAGHSMGGVSAAMYADKYPEQVEGIIFLGSYPASSTDLSQTELKVLSLYAEKDGLTTRDEVEKSKQNLPETASFVEIKGGNHAQFGIYGEQKGDQEADLTVKEQQDEIIKATLAFLE